MIAQYFVQLDQLPMTPNNKVDRNALPAPGELVARKQSSAAPLSDGVEQQIGAIWQELIGAASITADDNFFDLGGHSLLAVKAVQLMKDALGQRVPPQHLVTQNLREIAARFEVVEQAV